MPNLTWFGSPNFTPGRTDVEYVVIHWMDGYLAGADATFQNTTRQTSAHYGVEDDTIHQYVDEANTAWHAGNFDANARSIGIEHSAMPGRPATDATYASTIWLITGICQRYGLDPAVAILPHQHFTATSCPGTMDLPRIIAGVQAGLAGVSAQSGTITPLEGFLMALTDDEQRRLLAAADRINGTIPDRRDPNGNPYTVLLSDDGGTITDLIGRTFSKEDGAWQNANLGALVWNTKVNGASTAAGVLNHIDAKPVTATNAVTGAPFDVDAFIARIVATLPAATVAAIKNAL